MSIKRNKILKPYQSNSVELFNESGSHTWTIQTLMACAFLDLDITDPFRNRVLFRDEANPELTLDGIYVEDTFDLEGEEWRPIKEYFDDLLEDHYVISNKGRVKACRHIVHTSLRGKPVERHCPDIILKANESFSGYLLVMVHRQKGKDFGMPVHRAVASVFCTNDDPVNKTFVNHIDGNKLNNCADNLEWCTPKENMHHAIDTGLVTINKDTFIHQPLIHVETGDRYESMSAASRAMGKWYGYIAERIKLNKPCVDVHGNTWTIKFLDKGPSKQQKKNLFSMNLS